MQLAGEAYMNMSVHIRVENNVYIQDPGQGF